MLFSISLIVIRPFKIALFVHDGKFFDAVLAQDLLRVFERRADGRGDEVFLGHHVLDGLLEIGLETQIAVGENADELSALGDGHAADAVALHERHGVPDKVCGSR